MPVDRVSESRYSLLAKLQHILQTLGFPGIIVLVDRVDEPELVNGKPELMRLLIWPMLDNKLLKHPRMGFKLMLPQELQLYVDRESREFHDRARGSTNRTSCPTLIGRENRCMTWWRRVFLRVQPRSQAASNRLVR